jgi:hypothetical protein
MGRRLEGVLLLEALLLEALLLGALLLGGIQLLAKEEARLLLEEHRMEEHLLRLAAVQADLIIHKEQVLGRWLVAPRFSAAVTVIRIAIAETAIRNEKRKRRQVRRKND